MPAEDIHIAKLPAIRVASAYGFGCQPEEYAWNQLVRWAQPKGLLEDLRAHPIFGFNNPYPTPESPKYGYVFWIGVDGTVEPEGNIRIEEFFGGSYAVARCEVLGDPGGRIPAQWRSLTEWCRQNNHAMGKHPALEQYLSRPDDIAHLVMNLCCPIIEEVPAVAR